MAYYALSDLAKESGNSKLIQIIEDNDEDQGPSGGHPQPGPSAGSPAGPEQDQPVTGPSTEAASQTTTPKTGYAGLRKGFLLGKYLESPRISLSLVYLCFTSHATIFQS